MAGKLGKYFRTVRYMKPEQVLRRVGKMLGFGCALKGGVPARGPGKGQLTAIPELDFDSVFLGRFSTEGLMADRVTFLHEGEAFRWEGDWLVPERSRLWNFNLHYFEFLQPMAKAWLDTGDRAFLDKTVRMVRGWILANPREKGGDGWSAYTVSLRLTNWLAWLACVGEDLDKNVREAVEDSVFAQYRYLSRHLERDILANHYFENLKTLALCALYFGDTESLPVWLEAFRKECREQILPDGMHFERSPMYHKIVLEGLLRICVWLREAGMRDGALEEQAGKMLGAAWTMEGGLARIPLFHDSGDNVAKSLQALTSCARNRLGLESVRVSAACCGGFYFFTADSWRLIVDAGAAGPDYNPGHAHCNAMGFELYRDGNPFLVNCGTYGYQCAQRHWLRSTEAHNTVQVRGVEQSEIWSTFRMARRSRVRVLETREDGISMEMTDYRGNRIRREITLGPEVLHIRDRAQGLVLQSHLHSIGEIRVLSGAEICRKECMYAPQFGLLETIHQYTATGVGQVELSIPLPSGGDRV